MDELIFAGLVVPCHQSALETLRLSEITPHLRIAIDTVMSFRYVISTSHVITFFLEFHIYTTSHLIVRK